MADRPTLSNLPDLPLRFILDQLDLQDLIKCRLISKRFKFFVDQIKLDELLITSKYFDPKARSGKVFYTSWTLTNELVSNGYSSYNLKLKFFNSPSFKNKFENSLAKLYLNEKELPDQFQIIEKFKNSLRQLRCHFFKRNGRELKLPHLQSIEIALEPFSRLLLNAPNLKKVYCLSCLCSLELVHPETVDTLRILSTKNHKLSGLSRFTNVEVFQYLDCVTFSSFTRNYLNHMNVFAFEKLREFHYTVVTSLNTKRRLENHRRFPDLFAHDPLFNEDDAIDDDALFNRLIDEDGLIEELHFLNDRINQLGNNVDRMHDRFERGLDNLPMNNPVQQLRNPLNGDADPLGGPIGNLQPAVDNLNEVVDQLNALRRAPGPPVVRRLPPGSVRAAMVLGPDLHVNIPAAAVLVNPPPQFAPPVNPPPAHQPINAAPEVGPPVNPPPAHQPNLRPLPARHRPAGAQPAGQPNDHIVVNINLFEQFVNRVENPEPTRIVDQISSFIRRTLDTRDELKKNNLSVFFLGINLRNKRFFDGIKFGLENQTHLQYENFDHLATGMSYYTKIDYVKFAQRFSAGLLDDFFVKFNNILTVKADKIPKPELFILLLQRCKNLCSLSIEYDQKHKEIYNQLPYICKSLRKIKLSESEIFFKQMSHSFLSKLGVWQINAGQFDFDLVLDNFKASRCLKLCKFTYYKKTVKIAKTNAGQFYLECTQREASSQPSTKKEDKFVLRKKYVEFDELKRWCDFLKFELVYQPKDARSS